MSVEAVRGGGGRFRLLGRRYNSVVTIDLDFNVPPYLTAILSFFERHNIKSISYHSFVEMSMVKIQENKRSKINDWNITKNIQTKIICKYSQIIYQFWIFYKTFVFVSWFYWYETKTFAYIVCLPNTHG